MKMLISCLLNMWQMMEPIGKGSQRSSPLETCSYYSTDHSNNKSLSALLSCALSANAGLPRLSLLPPMQTRRQDLAVDNGRSSC